MNRKGGANAWHNGKASLNLSPACAGLFWELCFWMAGRSVLATDI